MIEEITRGVFIWITQYVAYFCLISIAAWAIISYIWGKKWESQVRDSGIYLIAIGTLTLVLALRPEKAQAMLWPPITWFSFTMLMVMELLWMSYLLELALRKLRMITTSLSQRSPNATAPQRPNYPRV